MKKDDHKADPAGDGGGAPEPTLEEKLELLPRATGVYIFCSERGRILYVGKAKNLRSRVRTYFTGRDDGRYQLPLLVSKIADLETIVTDNEIEALIVEANLIRRHRPRYNMDVRDDHTYPYLKVTREPYPRVFLTRKPKEDGARYYGPLTDVKRAKETLQTLRKATRIRTCNLSINDRTIAEGRHRVCLEFHIGNCDGPCEGRVTEEEYGGGVQMLVDAVHGRGAPLVSLLEKRMKQAAAELKFEEAARLRDQIESTRNLATRQKVLSRDEGDRDVFALAEEDQDACIAVLRMRQGRVVGRNHSFLSRIEGKDRSEVWASYLADYYVSETRSAPEEILLPLELEGGQRELIEGFFERHKQRRVRLVVPRRGPKARLLQLALRNAELLLAERRRAREKRDRTPHSLKSIADHLDLNDPPSVIECFDNSNLFGQQPVAAMVRFREGRPEKSQYRHYRIKTVAGIDDFASMQEVVGRRYRRLLAEEAELPDLVLIDGGQGQVNAARRILDSLELGHIPCVGLAKRLEEIVFPFERETITLPRTSSALKLLMRIRDEAHRFAVTYHRRLRQSAAVSSTLESLEGIGPEKARALLRHFGSLKKLREASPEQIARVKGFSAASAEKLLAQLGGEEEPGGEDSRVSGEGAEAEGREGA